MHLLFGFTDKRPPRAPWVDIVSGWFFLGAYPLLEMGEIFERRQAAEMVVLLFLYQADRRLDLDFVRYCRW
jgi:hypothetical protein